MEENGYGKSIDHVRDESREYGVRALDMNMNMNLNLNTKSTKPSYRLQSLNPTPTMR